MLHLVQVDVDDVLVAVQVTLQQLLVDQLEFNLATGLDVRGNGNLGNGSSVKKTDVVLSVSVFATWLRRDSNPCPYVGVRVSWRSRSSVQTLRSST